MMLFLFFFFLPCIYSVEKSIFLSFVFLYLFLFLSGCFQEFCFLFCFQQFYCDMPVSLPPTRGFLRFFELWLMFFISFGKFLAIISLIFFPTVFPVLPVFGIPNICYTFWYHSIALECSALFFFTLFFTINLDNFLFTYIQVQKSFSLLCHLPISLLKEFFLFTTMLLFLAYLLDSFLQFLFFPLWKSPICLSIMFTFSSRLNKTISNSYFMSLPVNPNICITAGSGHIDCFIF